jgi:hypothetical protein
MVAMLQRRLRHRRLALLPVVAAQAATVAM